MKAYISTDRLTVVMADEAPEGFTELTPHGEDLYAQALASMRARRNQLLRESDFYMLADAPISTAQRIAVAEYRQALRDLPETAVDPNAVSFPRNPIA